MPSFAQASSVRAGVGSTSERLNVISAGQSMPSVPAATPMPFMSRPA